MDILEIMRARHSVRQYTAEKIEPEKREALEELVWECNEASGLKIQLFFEEPKCFAGKMAHYGSFSGVENYIALVGKKGPDLEEKVGYYGEKLVLKAQELGLSTCWVALTHGKSQAPASLPSVTVKIRGSPTKTNHWRNSATALEKCRTGLPGAWRRCFLRRQR